MKNTKTIPEITNNQEEKPYDKCLSCHHLGITCDGPNLLAMTLDRWCEWCRKRKEQQGWTNSYIAEESGVSLPTIDRIMAGNCAKDVRRSTVADVSAVLIGSWGQFPCAHPEPVEIQRDNPEHVKKIDELTQEVASLKAAAKESEAHIEEMAQRRVDYLKALVEKHEARIERQESELKSCRSKLVTVLSVAAILSLVIAGALLVDMSNPNIGFFWLG